MIGTAANVGPFAYLRPGTILGAAGKIGTFVETKNATIGRGSKVPHLSMSATRRSARARTSARARSPRTTTGVAKHRTVIGDGVHTGVHNSLVAPVSIGDGATVGAGAVVRKDVPPGGARAERRPAAQHRGLAERSASENAADDPADDGASDA